MADRWRVTVQYVVDGTTHERTFTGHTVSSQVFGDRLRPRRCTIRCTDADGQVTETFQCNAETVHRQRITEEAP